MLDDDAHLWGKVKIRIDILCFRRPSRSRSRSPNRRHDQQQRRRRSRSRDRGKKSASKGGIDDAEREKRLKEMMSNADWRETQRTKNVKHYREMEEKQVNLSAFFLCFHRLQTRILNCRRKTRGRTRIRTSSGSSWSELPRRARWRSAFRPTDTTSRGAPSAWTPISPSGSKV